MITGASSLAATLHPALAVVEPADVGDVRRLAIAAANAGGFGDDAARVAIVATEIATNLVKYAREGRALVRLVACRKVPGVEIVAFDRGPGMADVAGRAVDGASTGGTLGNGLGAISRLSDLFDVFSCPGRGTILMARLWRDRIDPPADRRFQVGALAEAYPGELVSGDGWAVEQRGGRLALLVVDGLGHGPDAARAARAAEESFRAHHWESPEAVVGHIHRALARTRGAAVAVAEIDADAGRLRFCGIGNVAARLLGADRSTNLVSHYGIAGLEIRRMRAFDHPWSAGDCLVAHTDGLSPSWDHHDTPGVEQHHPLLLAATVARDAKRRVDDATVVALGEAPCES